MSQTMIERGRVISVHGRRITIKLDPGELCFGCMNHECKNKEGRISAVNFLDLPIKPDQLVETEVRTSSLALQGFQAALPPVLGFIAGFFLAAFLFASSGDGISILGGLIMMLIAGAGFYFFRRKFPPKTMSKVIGIVVEEKVELFPTA